MWGVRVPNDSKRELPFAEEHSECIAIDAITENVAGVGEAMASLTIRNFEEDTKERLRVRAAQNGRSVEEEARAILRATVAGATAADLWTRSRTLFAGAKGVDLILPSRVADQMPPAFDADE